MANVASQSSSESDNNHEVAILCDVVGEMDPFVGLTLTLAIHEDIPVHQVEWIVESGGVQLSGTFQDTFLYLPPCSLRYGRLYTFRANVNKSGWSAELHLRTLPPKLEHAPQQELFNVMEDYLLVPSAEQVEDTEQSDGIESLDEEQDTEQTDAHNVEEPSEEHQEPDDDDLVLISDEEVAEARGQEHLEKERQEAALALLEKKQKKQKKSPQRDPAPAEHKEQPEDDAAQLTSHSPPQDADEHEAKHEATATLSQTTSPAPRAHGVFNLSKLRMFSKLTIGAESYERRRVANVKEKHEQLDEQFYGL